MIRFKGKFLGATFCLKTLVLYTLKDGLLKHNLDELVLRIIHLTLHKQHQTKYNQQKTITQEIKNKTKALNSNLNQSKGVIPQ